MLINFEPRILSIRLSRRTIQAIRSGICPQQFTWIMDLFIAAYSIFGISCVKDRVVVGMMSEYNAFKPYSSAAVVSSASIPVHAQASQNQGRSCIHQSLLHLAIVTIRMGIFPGFPSLLDLIPSVDRATSRADPKERPIRFRILATGCLSLYAICHGREPSAACESKVLLASLAELGWHLFHRNGIRPWARLPRVE